MMAPTPAKHLETATASAREPVSHPGRDVRVPVYLLRVTPAAVALAFAGMTYLLAGESDQRMPFYEYCNAPRVLSVRGAAVLVDVAFAAVLLYPWPIRSRGFNAGLMGILAALAAAGPWAEAYVATTLPRENFDKWNPCALANFGPCGGLVLIWLGAAAVAAIHLGLPAEARRAHEKAA